MSGRCVCSAVVACVVLAAVTVRAQKPDEAEAPKPADGQSDSREQQPGSVGDLLQGVGEAAKQLSELLNQNEAAPAAADEDPEPPIPEPPVPEAVKEPAQEEPVEEDPTAPSKRFRDFAALLRDAERVKEMRAENERLMARNAELELRLSDISQIGLQGLLVGENDSSAALLNIAGESRLVSQGDILTMPMSRDGRNAQTVLVKKIDQAGVHLELSGEKKVVVVR